MKKLTAIICVIFAFVMVLALPVGAATPYQTYTYSIEGTALYSPDAYTPTKTIDAKYMNLSNEEVLRKAHPELGTLHETILSNQATVDELTAELLKYAPEEEMYKEIESKIKSATSAVTNAQTKYDETLATLSSISSPGDLEVDANENVYIADAGNNRIVVLDRYYKVKFILANFINGNATNFSSFFLVVQVTQSVLAPPVHIFQHLLLTISPMGSNIGIQEFSR